MHPTYPPFPDCEWTGFEVVFESISILKKKWDVKVMILITWILRDVRAMILITWVLRDVRAMILFPIAVIYRPFNTSQLSASSGRSWMHHGMRKVCSQFPIYVSDSTIALKPSNSKKKKLRSKTCPTGDGLFYSDFRVIFKQPKTPGTLFKFL